MSDRLETIALFVAVAEHESFAEAARRQNKTPTVVTRAVAALEDRLKVRLFNRTTRAVSLTEAGAQYLEVCRKILASCEELEALEPGGMDAPRGSLNVTAPAMFGRLHVIPAVSTFLVQYPHVDVRATLLDRVVSLVDEGIDVAVRLGDLPNSSLRAIRAGTVHMGVYAAPSYLAAHGEPATPRDLPEHTLISGSSIVTTPERWSFEGAKGVDDVIVKPRLIVNTTDGAAEAAACGLGLTYLVSYQVEAYIRAGRLQRVLADYEPPPIPIHIVHPAGRYLPSKVRLFIDHLVAELRAKFASSDGRPMQRTR
ncbi:MAG: LysR family transcriptional regulator [Gammaproteobacteria bacterium]|nr:LysR family transcriptional regulator [Gammaproteobacteria bacterium]